LEEAVEIVTRYFGGEVFSFSGRHYSVSEVEPLRLPSHLPPPRLVIGGGGRRVLSLAGRRADVASVFLKVKPEGSTFESSSPEAYRAKVDHVRASAGGRADDVEINVLLQAFEVTDDRPAAVARWAEEFEMTPDDFVALPFGLAGTLDEIVDDLQRRREVYGISYVTIFGEHLERFAPIVERLADR
jgi:alkanesulfonate monooxygenase SsuD/methylene tetrahydromethanopterin reductase-like flavin-dependent oxidoreductase (luciferase family)